MKRLAAVATFVAALAAARPGAAAWPWSDDTPQMSASLCRVPETALFTCKVSTRVVSICGQPQGGAVYRFGRQGHVELEVTGLHYVEHGFSDGGETQVYADTPTHRYIVYDQIVRTAFGPDGHHDPQAQSGLLVQSGGQIVSSRTCTEPMTFSPLAEKLIPGGDYVPHRPRPSA
jgi:hypothetical protein